MRPLAFITALLVVLLVPVAPAAAGGDWAWPVRGQVLTEFRNGDDPYAAGQHRGVDIAAPVGTPVVAASSGTVVFAGVVGSSGLVVSERTDDGRYELSYLHLSAAAVRRGDVVHRGDRVGAVGVSGTRSVQEPHLHFGVREAGDRHAYLDPLTFLAPPPAEAPDPAPAPVPVREPAPAGPAVAPALAAAPAFAPHAVGHAAHPVRHESPVHGASPTTAAVPHPGLTQHVRPVAASHGEGPSRHAPVSSKAPVPGQGPAASGVPAAAPVHAARPHATHHGGGIDIGWLAACAGLVVAAGLLAAPRSGGGRRPSARATFGALVRAASRT